MSALMADRIAAVLCAVALLGGAAAWGHYYVAPHDAYYDAVISCMADKGQLRGPGSREAYRACNSGLQAAPAPPEPTPDAQDALPDPCGLESVICPGEPGH